MTKETKELALVVEDNEDNMTLITKLLHHAGYDTIWAATGWKGVELAKTGQPDFILLDIQLPDIDGTQVLKEIRSSGTKAATVPIIAITSYAMAGDRQKLITAGCNGYIEKPIDPMRVIDQIIQIIKDPP